MEIPFDIEFIADSFNLDGRYVGYKVKNDGHINSTYVISFEDGEGCSKKYTLQKINTYVFYKIMNLYLNISVLRVIDELMTKTDIKVLKR